MPKGTLALAIIGLVLSLGLSLLLPFLAACWHVTYIMDNAPLIALSGALSGIIIAVVSHQANK